jgi:internalin A
MMKAFTLFLASVLILQILFVNIGSTQQPLTRTFAQWCQQKDELPDDTKHTINLMLSDALTTDCQKADLRLNKSNNLRISSAKISDLKPLASLNKLTSLSLISNRISDLTPLASLNKLTSLTLINNQIVDVRPLASLKKLIQLDLGYNQIVDIRPLAGLKKLTSLNLAGNQISDLRPLASLNKLTRLYLDPKFTKKDCPFKLGICVKTMELTDEEL